MRFSSRGGADFGSSPRAPGSPRKLEGIKCLACGRELPPFAPRVDYLPSSRSEEAAFVDSFNCPFCHEFTAFLSYRGPDWAVPIKRTILPIDRGRRALPADVPEAIAGEYREASAILEISPRASAAMSRRCLQSLLAASGGATSGELAKAIDQVIALGQLPKALADDLDAVRVIGNFAAHPMKSLATGTILDVEPGEAEWNLEVLEHLFEFYFVTVPEQEARRRRLNTKLGAAGKPPI
jgi:hypothetical protein